MDNNELKEMLGLILDKVSSLDTKVSSLDTKVSSLERGQNELKQEVSGLKQGQEEIKRHITNNNVAIGEIFIGALETQENKVNSIENKVKIIKSKVKIIEKITKDNTYELALLKAK